MGQECKMLNLCGFLKKHGNDNDLASLWFRYEYCTGEKQDECKRKQYMIANGKAPPDEMAPNGEMMHTDASS